MRIYDETSSLCAEVERAANEGMVDVAPPPIPSVAPKYRLQGLLDETKVAARHLLELQYVARAAYEGTLRALPPGVKAQAIAEVAEELRDDMNAVRTQLARLHDYQRIEPQGAAVNLERVTGIAAGMFGEAKSAKGLMIGELAMAYTAEALIDRREIIPSVRNALSLAAVGGAKRRAEELRVIAS